jgi:hypothetical protein
MATCSCFVRFQIYEGESEENLKPLIFFILQFIEQKMYTMTSFFYVVSIAFHTSVPELRKCVDTSSKKFFWLDRSHSCTACCTSSSDLKDFTNFLVHSYTCCSDRHASPYWTFIRRWISMGFTPSILKNGWQNSVLLWCMLQAGPPSLHYYCAVVLHSCIVVSPVGPFSNHEYHCC